MASDISKILSLLATSPEAVLIFSTTLPTTNLNRQVFRRRWCS